MQYVCLVYCEPAAFDRMSEEEQRTLNRDSLAYDRELQRSGHFIHANALQSTETAITLRVRDNRMSSSDGPFAETKEHLCGFILIEAADRDEALSIASAIPMSKYGSIEIRPVYEIPKD